MPIPSDFSNLPLETQEFIIDIMVMQVKKERGGNIFKKIIDRSFIRLFFTDATAAHTSNSDYYESAKRIAKAICRGAKTVCPYIERLP
mgnify:CR=1 FL=1